MNSKDLMYEIVAVRPYGKGKAIDVVWRHKKGAVLTQRVGPLLDADTGVALGNPEMIDETDLYDQFDVEWDASDDEVIALIEKKRTFLADDLTKNEAVVEDIPLDTSLVGRTG